MILSRDSRLINRMTAARLPVVAATLFFFAAVAGAQTGTRANLSNDVEDLGAEHLAQSARATVADARRHLESALSSGEGHIRFEALRGARSLKEEWIAEFVLPYCESPNLTEQVLALEAVTATGPELGQDVFRQLLDHEQRSVRLRALLGLEKLGDPDVAIEVIGVMEHDPDLDLRVVAARILGALGNPAAATALRRKITSHHAALREQSVLALLKIGREDVGDYLIEQLEADRDLNIFDAMRLLALVPDPTLIARLGPYLEAEDELVRTHASIAVLSILERSRTGAP